MSWLAEENHQHRKDYRDDSAEVGHERHQAADQRPHRRERHAQQQQADQPHYGHTESFERDRLPPIEECGSGGSCVGAEV